MTEQDNERGPTSAARLKLDNGREAASGKTRIAKVGENDQELGETGERRHAPPLAAVRPGEASGDAKPDPATTAILQEARRWAMWGAAALGIVGAAFTAALFFLVVQHAPVAPAAIEGPWSAFQWQSVQLWWLVVLFAGLRYLTILTAGAALALGGLLTLTGISTEYDLNAGRGEGANLSLRSASPGVLLAVLSLMMILAALYRDQTVPVPSVTELVDAERGAEAETEANAPADTPDTAGRDAAPEPGREPAAAAEAADTTASPATATQPADPTGALEQTKRRSVSPRAVHHETLVGVP